MGTGAGGLNLLLLAHRVGGVVRESQGILSISKSTTNYTDLGKSQIYFCAPIAPSLKCTGKSFPFLTHKDTWRMNEGIIGG